MWSRSLNLCEKLSLRTLLAAMSSEPPVAYTTVVKKSLTYGRPPEQANLRALGGGYDGDCILGNKGNVRSSYGACSFADLFDYDESISKYWPEFAQQGKEKITVRQLLAHQAGLFAIDETGDKSIIADLDRLAVVLARQKPAYEPGTQQVYHGITLGYYESELLRRVDPKHRSIGQYFQEEIAAPLGLDFYIRLPEEIPNTRLATLQQANYALAILTIPIPFFSRR